MRACFDREYSTVTYHKDRCLLIICVACSVIQAAPSLAISQQLLPAVFYKRQGLSLLIRGLKNMFVVIGHSNNRRKLRIKETLLIQKIQPQINLDGASQPIYLFNT